MSINIDEWVAKQRELLDEEWRAENELSMNELDTMSNRQLQRKGISLLSMRVSSIKIGLFGKTVIHFHTTRSGSASATSTSTSSTAAHSSASASSSAARSGQRSTNAEIAKSKAENASDSSQRLLPPHNISTGDIVRIVPYDPFSSSSSKPSTTGSNQDDDSKKKNQQYPSGIVSSVTDVSIVVAFSDSIEENGYLSDCLSQNDYFRIDRLPNEATRRKTLLALVPLEMRYPGQPWAQRLCSVLFENQPPKISAIDENIKFINSGLNDSQRSAVQIALSASDVAVIHGPPGSGKTTVVVELIYQAVKRGERVLVCTPSNIAVDNVVQRLGRLPMFQREGEIQSRSMRIARVGHPARLMTEVVKYSLDSLVYNADDSEIVRDAQEELRQVVTNLTRGKYKMNAGKDEKKGKKTDGAENEKIKRIGWKDAKVLRKEIRAREEKIVKGILSPFGTDVVCCTNIGAASLMKLTFGRGNSAGAASSSPNEPMFDMLIIDEASQAIEASCWISIPMARKLILAGDHKQLPPTILSEKAAKGGLETTLMDRVVSQWEKECVHMLDTQYRMNQKIMQWSSDEMYNGKLKAAAEVADRTLFDLDAFKPAFHNGVFDLIEDKKEIEEYFSPLLLIDTSGCGMDELIDTDDDPAYAKNKAQTERAGSKYNPGEAELVCNHVFTLLLSGVPADEIAVITPYNAQVGCVRDMLQDKAKQEQIQMPKAGFVEDVISQVEVRSVDGFQGREKEAVVLTLVRSNNNGQVGFLADQRRLNVAITRAKRHVCIICDVETLQKSGVGFLDRMVSYFQQHGPVQSAHELAHSQQQIQSVAVKSSSSKAKSKAKKAPTPPPPSSSSAAAVPKPPVVVNMKSVDVGNDKVGTSASAKASDPEPTRSTAKVPELAKNSAQEPERKNEIDQTPKPVGAAHVAAQQDASVETVSQKLRTLSLLATEDSESEDEPIIEKKEIDPQLEEIRRQQALKFAESKAPKKKKSSANKDKKPSGASASSMASSVPKPKIIRDVTKNNDVLPGESEEAYLERMAEASRSCHYKGCKTLISTLGVTCKFCRYRYCFSHQVPEVHGCMFEAMHHAKQTKHLTMSIAATGDIERKKMTTSQANAIKAKLSKKVAEKEAERAPKQKEKEKPASVGNDVRQVHSGDPVRMDV